MAAKPIITMGHPTLRKKAKSVAFDEFGSKSLNNLIKDLCDTCRANDGIGIAAPQIDVAKQVCIIELPEDSKRYDTKDLPHSKFVLINPVIKVIDKTPGDGVWEGCLSIPGIRGYVKRPRRIKVSYQDEQGVSKEILLKGFMAVVFQHEIDHLNGKLFVDRIVDSKHLIFEDNYQYIN